MSGATPRILVFGAHPDDAACHVGSPLSLYRELDFTVRMISDTDGAAGYDKMAGDDRARLNWLRTRWRR